MVEGAAELFFGNGTFINNGPSVAETLAEEGTDEICGSGASNGSNDGGGRDFGGNPDCFCWEPAMSVGNGTFFRLPRLPAVACELVAKGMLFASGVDATDGCFILDIGC